MSKEKNGKKKHVGWIILLLVIILAVLAFLFFFGKGGFGGFGFGGEGGASNSDTSDVSGNASDELVTVVIEIKENTILVDGDSVADENALKEKITEIGTSKQYEVVHETAIEDTYRKVYNVLKELEDVLSIKVNYNE